MTYYKPCQNCAADKTTCPVRDFVRRNIAGARVTSINFRCDERNPAFHYGQRVRFRWRVYDNSEEGAIEWTCVFSGTVLQEKGLRFIVRVDDARCIETAPENYDDTDAKSVFKNADLIIKVRPADMWASGEPDRVMCPSCAAYADETGRCQGYGNHGSWDSYWPSDCLRHDAQKDGTVS